MSMLERIELFENSQKQKKYAQERDEEHRKKNDRQAAIIQAKSLLNKKTNGKGPIDPKQVYTHHASPF